MTSLTIAKPEVSRCCHVHLEFRDTFKQCDGECNSWRVCCSRQFPSTWTRVRGEAVIRQGLTASSELTLPGDAKEAQENQAELSHAARCSPWEASANQNHLITSELLVLQSQKVFPGVEEVVVFFSLEGMSCLAELALGSGIYSSAVNHMKITPERIIVFTIFQLKGGNCRLELQPSRPCVWWDKSRWLLLPTHQLRGNPCNLPEVVTSKTLTILA